MNAPVVTPPWSHDEAEWYRPIGRQAIRLTGKDSISFLQSMLSQDLTSLAISDGRHALLLDAKGHLNADLFVYREADTAVLLLVEGNAAEETISRLQRFLIRTDAQFRVDEDVRFFVVHGASSAEEERSGISIESIRWDLGGTTRMVEQSEATPLGRELSFEEWERARIQSRIARWGTDLDESVLPHEAWLDGDAISFTKGCFLGQEVVCRIDSRGRSTRFLRVLSSDHELHVGEEIVRGGTVLGRVTSVTQTNEGYCALAFVHRSSESVADESTAGIRTVNGAVTLVQ